MVGRGGVDQGRPRHRPAHHQVDDPRLPRTCATRTRRTSATSTTTADDHIYARCAEHYNKTYGIVHPARAVGQPTTACGEARSTARQEDSALLSRRPRATRTAPVVRLNADLLDRYAGRCAEPRPHEWDARWWSPITNAEHLHLREHVGMVDLTPFNEFDMEGSGCRRVPAAAVREQRCDVAVGRSVYTPLLTPGGGFRADLTIMRLGESRFRVVTGAFDGGRDRYSFRRHLPVDGFSDVHRPHVGPVHDGCRDREGGGDDGADRHRLVAPLALNQEAFPYGSVRDVLIDGVPCTMFRISCVARTVGGAHGHRPGPPGCGTRSGRPARPTTERGRHRRVRRRGTNSRATA